MAMRSARGRTAHRSAALLLHSRVLGEADLILQFFTRDYGRISVIGRSARKSRKRFGGALEPFHQLSVEFDDRGPDAELGVLRDATVQLPRVGIVKHLENLELAGRGLAWVRHALPPRTPEPAAWRACGTLLDALNSSPPDVAPRVLAEFGFDLCECLGWALELDACVVCRRPCPEGQSAGISPARGGVVCRECGGAQRVLRGPTRMRLIGLGRGEHLETEDAESVIALVEDILRAHAGLD
ncbi:MAG: DNA repair protein RecO [Polyangiaceae bacterium]|nr:DNA repair protein RecO [Myxococcales bacterium]MCB9590293.1 DNA repair protein RecO [Polyangiaceae bacterium]MCB9605052.1 DNA repair protein RecO [Polyangiaceae bacterium]